MSSDEASLWNLAASDSSCLGTRSISVRRSENSPSSGMAATFSCPENETHSLLVLVTDGKSTFQGKIDPKEVTKISWTDFVETTNGNVSDAMKITILSSFLLQNVDRVDITYDYIQDERIKLSIKEKLSTTAVTRVLGTRVLEPLEFNLSFASILGTTVNDNNTKIQQLQTEKESMRVNLLNWKDTAEKLDRDWQREKDALLNRFLELYKKAHGELREARLEIQCLKRQVSEARAMASTEAVSKKRQRLPPPTLNYAALPDDQDEEQFSSEMVDMLAAGQPTRKPTKTNGTATSKAIGDMRLNPHTGAKEVYDVDSFLQQETQDQATSAAETAAKKDTASSTERKDNTTANTDEKNEIDKTSPANDKKTKGSSPDDDVMAIAAQLFNKKNKSTSDEGEPAKRARHE